MQIPNKVTVLSKRTYAAPACFKIRYSKTQIPVKPAAASTRCFPVSFFSSTEER